MRKRFTMKRTSITLLALTLFCCLGPRLFAEPPAPEAALDGARLYEHVRSASLEILVHGRLDGSGWFASEDGLVVTAAHVVWNRVDKSEGSLEVMSPTLGRLDAQVLCVDRGHDLALLRAKVGEHKAPYLNVAHDMPAPLDDAFLFGMANFRHDVLIRGSVARAATTFEYFDKEQSYVEMYHVSAPSPPGTSGGCWVDRRGRVIGNQSGFVTLDRVGVGIALVAPPGAIRRLVAERTGAKTPTLGCGLEELGSQSVGYIARFPARTSGLAPVLLVPGGPADKAKLGDTTLITAIDGHAVARRDDLLSHIVARKPGETVKLTALAPDGGKSREIEVTLGMLEELTAPPATVPATQP
jgi:S1-C subfamily serine protease